MSLKLAAVVLSFILVSIDGIAGFISHGGDAVVCFKERITFQKYPIPPYGKTMFDEAERAFREYQKDHGNEEPFYVPRGLPAKVTVEVLGRPAATTNPPEPKLRTSNYYDQDIYYVTGRSRVMRKVNDLNQKTSYELYEVDIIKTADDIANEMRSKHGNIDWANIRNIDDFKGSIIHGILIDTIYPYDLQAALFSKQRNEALWSLKNQDFNTVLEMLFKSFHEVPAFESALRYAYHELGAIEQSGIPMPMLDEIPDEGNINVSIPRNCIKIQAVQRLADQYLYDVNILKRMTPFNKAILQLHEILYYIATEHVKEKADASDKIRLLILSLLTAPLSKEELQQKLKLYKFELTEEYQKLLQN